MTELRRGKRLRPVSVKRAAEADAWWECKAAVYERDRGVCQAHARGLVPPDLPCEGQLDPHHLWPTGTGGPRCDPDNVITCCRRAHDWAHHEDPRQARALGLIRREVLRS